MRIDREKMQVEDRMEEHLMDIYELYDKAIWKEVEAMDRKQLINAVRAYRDQYFPYKKKDISTWQDEELKDFLFDEMREDDQKSTDFIVDLYMDD